MILEKGIFKSQWKNANKKHDERKEWQDER